MVTAVERDTDDDDEIRADVAALSIALCLPSAAAAVVVIERVKTFVRGKSSINKTLTCAEGSEER